MLHVLLLLGVIGFSDGHSDTFVPGSSVLHWDRSECISQKAASVAIVAYLPIFFFSSNNPVSLEWRRSLS